VSGQDGSAFSRAAGAAGALALEAEPGRGRLSMNGDAAAFGLSACAASGRLERLHAAAAPGDRACLDALSRPGGCDIRLRVIGEDAAVRYARLIGSGDGEVWRGLLIPAGADPEGGLARIDLETELGKALGQGDVIAHHQPVVSLSDRRLAGFEALARWIRPGGGVLSAEEFLPLAEERAMTARIGEAVRACAARDAAAWRAARPDAKTLFVAANATAGELCSPGFADTLVEAVRNAGLARGVFKLEVSETEVMRDPEAAETAMKRLKAAGVSLVLDDFGTGYSSLARLDRFPFDTIKIDQYFIRAATADASARAIIASVVRIARSYAMTVVAEGVETEDAARLCAEMGCDYGQGFRFARALAPQDAADAVTAGLEGRFSAP